MPKTCSRCGGIGSLDGLDEEPWGALVGGRDTCYHCQETGTCQTPGCTDCGAPTEKFCDRIDCTEPATHTVIMHGCADGELSLCEPHANFEIADGACFPAKNPIV